MLREGFSLMRIVLINFLVFFFFSTTACSQEEDVGGVEDFCNICACKCGPGYRLSDGHCASWKQHRRYQRCGGYPFGTVDELWMLKDPKGCTIEGIRNKRERRGGSIIRDQFSPPVRRSKCN
jgi:hypothetical protein